MSTKDSVENGSTNQEFRCWTLDRAFWMYGTERNNPTVGLPYQYHTTESIIYCTSDFRCLHTRLMTPILFRNFRGSRTNSPTTNISTCHQHSPALTNFLLVESQINCHGSWSGRVDGWCSLSRPMDFCKSPHCGITRSRNRCWALSVQHLALCSNPWMTAMPKYCQDSLLGSTA